MPKCGKPHTPIVSKKQQGKFGSELSKREKGGKGTMPGITKAELKSHLKESGKKRLPEKAKKSGKKSTTDRL